MPDGEKEQTTNDKESKLPTALRVGPYRFFFYAGDHHEPQHIHVERDDKIAKFWLDPIRLQSSGGSIERKLAGFRELFKNIRRN